jgi:hypothetical protein
MDSFSVAFCMINAILYVLFETEITPAAPLLAWADD